MQKFKFLILTLFIFIQACGGRQVKSVAEVSSLDNQLTCSHISGEYQVNNQRVTELIGEKGQKGGANIGMVLLLGPASLPFIDVSGSEKKEIEAITLRNKTLERLASVKSCGLQPYPLSINDD